MHGKFFRKTKSLQIELVQANRSYLSVQANIFTLDLRYCQKKNLETN